MSDRKKRRLRTRVRDRDREREGGLCGQTGSEGRKRKTKIGRERRKEQER